MNSIVEVEVADDEQKCFIGGVQAIPKPSIFGQYTTNSIVEVDEH